MLQHQESMEAGKKSFVISQQGSSFVELIIIVALFCFVVIAGMRLLAGSTSEKFEEQARCVASIGTESGPCPNTTKVGNVGSASSGVPIGGGIVDDYVVDGKGPYIRTQNPIPTAPLP